MFKPNRPGYVNLAIEPTHVQQVILDSDEFKGFTSTARALTESWFETHRPALETIKHDTKPNDLISALGDDLLARFRPTALLDEYDVYEQLMAYWHGTMHDDVFLIMSEGWSGAGKPRRTIEDKDRKLTEAPDLVIGSGRNAAKYKMDLIPPSLIVARYFPNEQAKVDELTFAAEEVSRAGQEYIEEHAVEGGLLEDAIGDTGKITKASANTRLRVARYEKAERDEIQSLQHIIGLFNAESVAKAVAKAAQEALDIATLKQYAKLTDDDVKVLVLDDKWGATVTNRVTLVADGLTQALVNRIRALASRYAETESSLADELESLRTKVEGHLAAMGIE